MILTDEIDICDAESEMAHEYVCKDKVGEDHRTLPYEGNYQLPWTEDSPRDRNHVVKDHGRIWKNSCTFTAKVNPENSGVKLRRRSYYGFGAKGDLSDQREEPTFTSAQRVRVEVDGKSVGEWFLPAGHARDTWLDSDFAIPAEATRGKKQIRIALSSLDSTHWDEYTYWIYSYVDGGVQLREVIDR